ncbi:MAG TPA: hypothetical protein VKX39_11545 [Bryobacteraceae bacterium]|nr:hypothetical protein [Bryobacteraceae bacterium]
MRHEGHIDYLQNGRLQHVSGDRVEEHRISVGGRNPERCTPGHGCGQHERGHQHGENCGHPAVPHGDHVDYLVGGHLHHCHGDHCDDHGAIEEVIS